MLSGRRKWRLGKPFSLGIALAVVLGGIFIVLPSYLPNVKAGYVDHDVANLDVLGLTDWGSLAIPLEYMGVPQVVGYFDGMGSYYSMSGLIFDQISYDHSDPAGLPDFYDSGWGLARRANPDFNVTASDTPIYLKIDNSTVQKSYGSFTQVDSQGTIGVANDVRIHQTAWTSIGNDWAIIEWVIENINFIDLNVVNVAFGAYISDPVLGGGPGGDGDDDVDNWDTLNSLYYVQDDFGTGDVLGFASAVPSNPFNHYYANDINARLLDDDVTYKEMTGPNAIVGGPGGTRIAVILSWNGYSILSGTSEKFAMVIAFGQDVAAMEQAVKDAQDYYLNPAGSIQITEIQDSSSSKQKIEIFNGGGLNLDVSSWEIRNSAGAPITGNWIPDANLPTDEHRFLDVSAGTLDPESDIIYLYNDTGILYDSVGYGQFGPAPDPIDTESTSRIWNSATQLYTDDWAMTLPGLSIPSFGIQNTVPMIDSTPELVLNSMMFNPMEVIEGHAEIMYTGNGTLDISGYRLVGDIEFTLPPGTVLDTLNQFFILNQVDSPTFFSNLETAGDNVYLYDDTGRLLDMVGWSSPHTQGYFMARIPGGAGTHRGYNDPSSTAAGWQFDQVPFLQFSYPCLFLRPMQLQAALLLVVLLPFYWSPSIAPAVGPVTRTLNGILCVTTTISVAFIEKIGCFSRFYSTIGRRFPQNSAISGCECAQAAFHEDVPSREYRSSNAPPPAFYRNPTPFPATSTPHEAACR